MKKFKIVNTLTGRESVINEGTLRALKKLPSGYEMVSEYSEDAPVIRVLEPVAKAKDVIRPAKEEPDEPSASREDMIQFLKEKGVNVHPNLGDKKIRQKYEDTIAENR